MSPGTMGVKMKPVGPCGRPSKFDTVFPDLTTSECGFVGEEGLSYAAQEWLNENPRGVAVLEEV